MLVLKISICSHWKKNFICKHIIAISVNIDLCEFPAVDLKIEGNRRRGRPGKAAKALENYFARNRS